MALWKTLECRRNLFAGCVSNGYTHAMTKVFKETVQTRASREAGFRRGLLTEELDCFLSGEMDEEKVLLRDHINGTTSFEELARLSEKTPRSLMFMPSESGNPLGDYLFTIVSRLQAR